MTTIKYKKKSQKSNLIFGLLWFVLGIIAIIYDQSDYFKYGYLGIGVLYLASYLFQNHYQYVTITEESITKHSFPSKKMLLSEITEVRDFAGDYKLISDSKTISIQKDLIEPSSLQELEMVFKTFQHS